MKLTCTINGQPAELEIQEVELLRLTRPQHLTRFDLKARWGVCLATVDERIKRIGKIKDGRSVRFPIAEVEAYERKHTIKTR